MHDVVPFDRGADLGRAQEIVRGGVYSARRQGKCHTKESQAFACANVVDKSGKTPARSARILPQAPGLSGSSGTSRGDVPPIWSALIFPKLGRDAGLSADPDENAGPGRAVADDRYHRGFVRSG